MIKELTVTTIGPIKLISGREKKYLLSLLPLLFGDLPLFCDVVSCRSVYRLSDDLILFFPSRKGLRYLKDVEWGIAVATNGELLAVEPDIGRDYYNKLYWIYRYDHFFALSQSSGKIYASQFSPYLGTWITLKAREGDT